MKQLLLAILFCPFCLFAQSDSTDFNFYSTAPNWENDDDSLIYPSGYYKELHLDFHISDVAASKNIWIELSELGRGNILFHYCFSKQYLIQNGFMNQGDVSISLGNWSINSYQVCIVLENTERSYSLNFKRSLIL